MSRSAIPLHERGSLNVSETADYLGVSKATVYRLMDEKRLRWFYLGKLRRIIRASVEQYMEAAADFSMGEAS
jgi:excisionase family DNA binding protein